jgi:hypothetical protein
MTATPATRGQGGGPLGRWIVGPLVVLAALVGAVALLPSHGCGPGITLTHAAGGVLYLALAAVATGLAVGAGIWRLRRVDGTRAAVRAIAILVSVVVAILLLIVVGEGGIAAGLTFVVFILGLAATGGALLSLLAALVNRRDADEVGLALPLYLLGSGLFVYPPLVDIVAGTVSGTYGC